MTFYVLIALIGHFIREYLFGNPFEPLINGIEIGGIYMDRKEKSFHYPNTKYLGGFYVDIESFPAPLAKTEEELERILVDKTYFDYSEQDYEDFYTEYMGACNGNSIDNILNEVKCLND